MRIIIDRRCGMLQPMYAVLGGEQGIGKTSLAVAMICDDYRYYRDDRMTMARQFCDRYRRDTGRRLHIRDHVYYSNIPIVLDPKTGARTHYIDPRKLRLPDGVHPVTYLPYGAIVFVQESDNNYYAREWKRTPQWLIALLKLYRHHGLTIIFDTQSDSLLDKHVRNLATDLYQVESRAHKRGFLWIRPKWTWNYWAIRPQRVRALADLQRMGVPISARSIAHKCAYRYRGDVYARYNSYSGSAYFVRGLVDYNYDPMPSDRLDDQAVADYCERCPVVVTAEGESDHGEK